MPKAKSRRRKMRILEYLEGNSDVPVRDIANDSGITVQSAGTQMKTLRNRGLVEVTGKMPTQGRSASLYTITGKGEDKLDWMRDIVDIINNRGISWTEAVGIWKNRP